MNVHSAALMAMLLLTACAGGPHTPQAGLPPEQSPPGTTPPISEPRPEPLPNGLNWSDPGTWQALGQPVPTGGSTVTIPAGQTVLLDTDTPALAGLQIDGTLHLSDTFTDPDSNGSLDLTAAYVLVHGELHAGTPTVPYAAKATITLTDPDPTRSVMNMGTRGILVMGGALSLHAAAPETLWTKLSAHAASGATQLSVLSAAGWKAGDRIAVAPTDFYGVSQTEAFDLMGVSGTSLTLGASTQAPRWGTVQTFDEGRVTVDQRAEVVNLTRSIVIQAPDDAAWREQGFGAQVKNMEGTVQLDGVELRRAGQAGKVGMYPLHWHGLSYNTDGTERGDVSGQYVRGSVITESRNRCIVIHGTNGVQVQDNVCHDVVGHAVFLEDGVERRSTITGNVVLKVRNPPAGTELQKHEGNVFSGGSSGFWISNPDNTVSHNVAADTQGSGFWLSFADRPVGLYRNVPITPDNIKFGAFDDNTAHGNRWFGLNLDWVAKDDAGNIEPRKYMPTLSETWSDRYDEFVPFSINRFHSFKHDRGAVWNRAWALTMHDFVLADNAGTAFEGASSKCFVMNSAVVGTTANSATRMPANRPPSGVATYHSACDVTGNTLVNLPFVNGYTSGAFATDDYYLRPVEKGLVRNVGNRLVNSHPGFRTPLPDDNWVLAGAIWDPQGLWGPAGNYWVYDLPFLTAGTMCQQVAPAGQNGQSCAGPYYGLANFTYNDSRSTGAYLAMDVTRNDNGAVWKVGNGNLARMLGNMRHAALVKGGTYTLRFPEVSAPGDLSFAITNMLTADDEVLLAVPFSGTTTPRGWVTTWPNYTREDQFEAPWFQPDMLRRLSPASSLAQVQASNGEVFWQDTANDLVWLKVKGGLTPATAEPGSDTDLYRVMHVVLKPAL